MLETILLAIVTEYIPLVVTRADSVKAVEDGTARSLSCGYTCDIEWTSGNWMGMDYDCIQRNIKYNHVALVPTGRAGDGNAVRMDAGEVELPKTLNKENEDNMSMKTIPSRWGRFSGRAPSNCCLNSKSDSS